MIVEKEVKRDYQSIDSFIVLMCLAGSGTIDFGRGKISYTLGDTLLVPNQLGEIDINPEQKSKLMEVYIS